MYVIDVIPIAKAISTDTLSYFTSKKMPVGAIVSVPLRKKKVQGIVSSMREAEDLKSELRSADFALRKLDKVRVLEFFTKEFMEMACEASDYFASSPGSIIDVLVPDYILKNVTKLKSGSKHGQTSTKNNHEKYAVQGSDEERYGSWKSLIRQEFARKKSLFFLVPTIEEAEYAYSLIEKGIEGYAFVLHGNLEKKVMIESWNKALKEKHPVAIIATGAFLSFPRNDIETIIIEGESHRAYKIPRRPFLDIRQCAEILARKKGIKIFFGDNFLRLETLSRELEGDLVEASPFKFRSLSTAKDTLVDMRLFKDQNRKSFKILSDEMKSLISHNKEESEHMIILATRRGVAPSTVCGDCQNIVTCTNCSSPVVLHKAKSKDGNDDSEKRFFLCHRCGERRSTEEYCRICGSWRLGVVGIGIDLVEEKIKDSFPDIALFKIDSDSTPNDKTAKAVVNKFKAKPGSVLLGTEMMFQYLRDKVENSAIVSLDSLFSLPDFRIQERIMHILLSMRSITSKNILVQTRKAEDKVFEYGMKGNMSDFLRTSLEERKNFKYPPYSTLIKLTIEGKKDKIVEEMRKAQENLSPYEIDVFPAFTHTIKGNSVLHGLIRLPRENWIDKNLIEKLRLLSPKISIKVDPETLL